MIGLQLSNSGALTIVNDSNVVFNTTILSTDSNLTYNTSTGVVTFASAGTYSVNWFVSNHTVASTEGAIFAVVANSTDYYSGSTINNGMVGGSLLLDANASSTLSLQNISQGTVSLSSSVPTNATLNIVRQTPSVATEGFSAYLSTVSVSANTQLTGWTTSAPYFTSPSGSFNATTGNYTVPYAGTYSILATINFATTAAISASLGSSVVPAFVVTRTSPTSTNLITALMPVLNIDVTVLSLRALLGNGSVNIAGEVELNEGDVISLQYESSGLTLTLNLGDSSGIVWTVQRVT